jgi:glycogen debranching enzyme
VRGAGADVRAEARRRFLQPLLDHLSVAGVGHISEIADAEPPYTPRGCPFQAWSVGEALRLDRLVLKTPDVPQAERRPRAQPVKG